jgi:hypothetical protein
VIASERSTSPRRAAAEPPGERRQQHENHDRREVLDHEPADGDLTVDGIEKTPALERPQQHHGAGHRQREAEDDTRAEAPSPERRHDRPERGRRRDLTERARDRDPPDRQQVFQREVHPTPNMRSITPISASSAGELDVRDEARVAGPMTMPASR